MSAFAQKVKRFYDMGLYSAVNVYSFYERGKFITIDEYHEIVGEGEPGEEQAED